MSQPNPPTDGPGIEPRAFNVSEPIFPPVDPNPVLHEPRWAQIADIPLTLTVEFGSTSLTLDDIARISTGSIIELDQSVGESVLLSLNGKPAGRGEISVHGDQYAVRLVEMFVQPMAPRPSRADAPEDAPTGEGGAPEWTR